MSRLLLYCPLALALFADILSSQQADIASFDVASIRSSAPGTSGSMFNLVRNGTLSLQNLTTRALIHYAYDCDERQILGGASWLDKNRYDVTAKAESPLVGDARVITRAWLKALLAERFQLIVHSEVRQMRVLVLTVAKDGAKLHESASDQDAPMLGRGISMQDGVLTANHVPLMRLIPILSDHLGRKVIDRTGRAGVYDFKLQWKPDQVAASGNDPDDAISDRPNLVTALREQLGLHLKTDTAPTDVIIVDRISEPPTN